MATNGTGEIIMSPECRACTDLGLDPFTDYRTDTGWSRVVEAHRMIVKRYHPDQFAGAAEAERQAATDRTVEANRAYTLLGAARRSSPRF